MTAIAPVEEGALGPLAEATPVAALGRARMSPSEHFRRDHFPAPPLTAQTWAVSVGGAARAPLAFAFADLVELAAIEQRVVLECAGHRRTEHDPVPKGLAWGIGAMGEATWTGIPLARVLELVAPHADARYVELIGADEGEVPRGGVERYSRTIPIEKAQDTLLAYAVEGEPISTTRGGPVRAIVPGWYATDSVKWLTRIELRHDLGHGFFDAEDYYFRAPGETGRGVRLSAMPIHALITSPDPGLIRGTAWGGNGGVAHVDVSIDDGPWQRAHLGAPRGRWARRFWRLPWEPTAGEHVLAVRATDASGAEQPSTPRPNVGGYANNSVHRVTCWVDHT